MLNTEHAYGNITDTLNVIKQRRKIKHLNTLEKYHIYKFSKNRLHINDAYIYNPIFETLQVLNTR
jgi:hypothetical protein